MSSQSIADEHQIRNLVHRYADAASPQMCPRSSSRGRTHGSTGTANNCSAAVYGSHRPSATISAKRSRSG